MVSKFTVKKKLLKFSYYLQSDKEAILFPLLALSASVVILYNNAAQVKLTLKYEIIKL